MKSINLKKINWKDPKMIFPIVLFFPLLFLGWMIYGISQDFSEPSTDETEVQQEGIADVPMGDSVAIESKADALLEAYRNEQDFSAISLANEYTRIASDTTIYTEEELALLAAQEKEAELAKLQIVETNQQIQEQNALLAENRRSLTSGDIHTREDGSSSLDKEIIMYQKLLRGEEILTPAEEEARKIEAIRQEERAKVLHEMNSRETNTVEKVSNNNSSSSSAFNTVGKQQEESSYIRAMVDQGAEVTMGSRIRFRLLDDIRIQGHTIPSGTHIYALVTDFGEQRVKATVTSIVARGKRVKVNLSVFDSDGIEGFFVPKSAFRDFTKEAGSQALGQGNVNFTSSPETLEGVALQTLQGVYQSASSALSNKIRENKAKIKYNTTIYLINSNE